MIKKTYITPEITVYNKEELLEIIEAGACSSGYSCFCHNGGTNANK